MVNGQATNLRWPQPKLCLLVGLHSWAKCKQLTVSTSCNGTTARQQGDSKLGIAIALLSTIVSEHDDGCACYVWEAGADDKKVTTTTQVDAEAATTARNSW